MGNDVAGVMGEDCGTPMVNDRFRGVGLLVNDHRAGETAVPSRKPSSNRLGQPSSVGLEVTLPPQRVSTSKSVSAQLALMIFGFEMYL